MSDQIVFPGDELRQRREELELTYHDVYEHLHIPIRYVQALEQGAWDSLPAEAFVNGYLKSYCGLLGLDPNRFVDSYRAVLEGPPDAGRLARLRNADKSGSLTREIRAWAAVCAVLLLLWITYMVVFTPSTIDQAPAAEAGTQELVLPDTDEGLESTP